MIALVVFVLDQLTKGWIQRMPSYDSITVIPHFFSLVHLENSGAAFGILQNSTSPWKVLLLVGFSLLALIVVFAMIWRNRNNLLTSISLGLIFGGACGNLFDRLVRGSVVDFLLFYVRQWEWPAFNVADSAIVIGASLLVWEILSTRQQENQPAGLGASSGN